MVGYDSYKVLLGNIVEFLEFYFREDFLSCALFGSVARNQALPESDIDLLIVHRSCSYRPMEKFLKLLGDLEEDTEYKRLKKQGYFPDPYPVFLDEKELEKNPLILLDILDHGIILYDGDGILDKRLFSLKKRLQELGAEKISLSDGSYYWDLKPDWKPREVIEI